MNRILPLLFAVLLMGVFLAMGITQQVPVGNVRGKVILPGGKPLANALVTFSPKQVDHESAEYLRTRYAETRADGTFELRSVPADVYDVSVGAEYHSLPDLVVTIEEGVPTDLNLNLKRGPDQLTMYANQKVFTPSESPTLEVHGFTEVKKFEVVLRRLDESEVVKAGGIGDLVRPLFSAGKDLEPGMDQRFPVAKTIAQAVTKRDAEGAFIERINVGKLPEGLYWVTLTIGALRQQTALNVSQLAIVTKAAQNDNLIYATDLATGKPIPGAEIFAQGPKQLEKVGITGPDGTLRTELPYREGTRQGIVGRYGKSVAVVDLWGTRPESAKLRTAGYTERPVYRPGDTVKFKGVLRNIEGVKLSAVRGGTVNLQFTDPTGTELATATRPISDHGTFDGEFPTSKEAEPGLYTVKYQAGGSEDQIPVTIAAYRKPEYTVKVSPSGGPFFLGQTAQVVVQSDYYFGGPVVGAQVRATVTRAPLYSYEDENGESYEYDGGGGSFFRELTGTTDAAGRAILAFDTRAEEGEIDEFTTDYRYTVAVSVADEAGKYFDGEGSVNVLRGDLDLSVISERSVASPGENSAIEVQVVRSTGDKSPVAGKAVRLEVSQWRWSQKSSVRIPRDVFTGTTGADGKAKFNLPLPKAGSFDLTARIQDDQGRSVAATDSIWVSGTDEYGFDPETGLLDLVLDKRKYSVGDTARVLIQTNEPGGSALVTVQADRILYKEVVELSEPMTLWTMPVTLEHAPNVFVSATYVHGKQFREDTARLTIDRDDRAIQVSVKSERESYQPGETARLTVATTDLSGKPVAADVSVGVVDESIYAILEDQTNLREALNPRRYDSVQTNYSFPEIYLDGGDKGNADVPLRKRFQDTAFWQPSVWTGPAGTATVDVLLPDNLTQWRATAIGVTDEGAAGQTTQKFRARKPLMVRISPPTYLVQGDRQQVVTSVTNDTGQDADVQVELGVAGVTGEGELRRTVRVRAGSSEAIPISVVAGDPGEAVLTARVRAGSDSDGVESRFPVVPHGREEVTSAAAEARPSAQMELELKSGAVAKAGGLTVRVAPSLAGGVLQTLDKLVDYPYGCVEQTMSRFLPAVVVADALKRNGVQRSGLEAKIPLVAADGLARLAKMQHSDGGWGWWEYDQSDLFMTALVLDGLERAAKLGYESPGIDMERALKWSQTRLASPTKEDRRRDRLYLSYALLKLGKPAPRLENMDLVKADAAELATAALAYHEAKLFARRDEALNKLAATADGGLQARWAPSENAWGEEPTALALVALVTIRPDDPLIPRIVRGLMARKRGDGWHSTRDTSYSVQGLSMVLARETASAGTVTLRLNGKELRQIALDPSRPEGDTVVLKREELTPGPLRLEVLRTDGGVTYATAELRQFVAEKEIPAMATDSGLQVKRTYRVLESQTLENGVSKLMPSERPVSQVRAGDLVRVEVVINADRPREFVMIEDPTPSNCRVTEREQIGANEEWGWWYSRVVVRDDRIAIFARYLSKGENKISYTMRAEGPGRASALPLMVGEMYDPAQWASTGETSLEVRP